MNLQLIARLNQQLDSNWMFYLMNTDTLIQNQLEFGLTQILSLGVFVSAIDPATEPSLPTLLMFVLI